MKHWVIAAITLIAVFGSATFISFLQPSIEGVEARPDILYPGQEFKVFFRVENHLRDKNLSIELIDPEGCLIQKRFDEFEVFIPVGGKAYYAEFNSSNSWDCKGDKIIMLRLKDGWRTQTWPVSVQIAQIAE